MPKGMPRSQGSSGEAIQHFSHIRLRVVGSGTLKFQLSSLDDSYLTNLPNHTMAAVTDIEPTVLTNFVTQRARLKFYTENENEWMRVNRVIIFLKDFGSEYPM
jgi:hypothetical protein